MSNIILGVSLVVNIIALAVIIALYIRVEDKFGIFDTIITSQGKIYQESLKESFELYKSLDNIYKNQMEIYGNLLGAYKTISDGYKLMDGHFRVLLENWKEINEQYTVSCDQFEEIEKALADIYAKITEHKCQCHIGPAVDDREEEENT